MPLVVFGCRSLSPHIENESCLAEDDREEQDQENEKRREKA